MIVLFHPVLFLLQRGIQFEIIYILRNKLFMKYSLNSFRYWRHLASPWYLAPSEGKYDVQTSLSALVMCIVSL